MGGEQRRLSLRPTQSGRRISVVHGGKSRAAGKKISRDTYSRKFATDPRRHPHQEKGKRREEGEEEAPTFIAPFHPFGVIRFVYPLVGIMRCSRFPLEARRAERRRTRRRMRRRGATRTRTRTRTSMTTTTMKGCEERKRRRGGRLRREGEGVRRRCIIDDHSHNK